jgi:hypothetical protein
MPHSILLKIRIRIYRATRSMRKKQPKEKYLHQRLNPSRETIEVFSLNPTSPFAAGPQGKLLVIKVLLLIEYRSKALTLSEHM